jgi:hypothetical protein
MNDDILKKVKSILLRQISDDYTDISYMGILESEVQTLNGNQESLKQYALKALGDLLEESKIRVGNLRNDGTTFLRYWDMESGEIIKRLNSEWINYFGPNHWKYDEVPIFDLTEEYAKQIGKYESDKEKFKKEIL